MMQVGTEIQRPSAKFILMDANANHLCCRVTVPVTTLVRISQDVITMTEVARCATALDMFETFRLVDGSEVCLSVKMFIGIAD